MITVSDNLQSPLSLILLFFLVYCWLEQQARIKGLSESKTYSPCVGSQQRVKLLQRTIYEEINVNLNVSRHPPQSVK